MSSRQLRKLQKQKELKEAQAVKIPESDGGVGSEDEGDNFGSAPAPKPRVSLFAALGGGDDDEEDDDDENDNVQQLEQNPGVSEEQEQSIPEPVKKSKNKNKKKKKKAKTNSELAGAAEAAETISKDDGVDAEEDEIDRAIKELKLTVSQQQSPASGTDTGSRLKLNELLSINTYHLKAVNEMRNLFGRDVMESANAEEEQEQQRRRRGPAQRQVDLETFLRAPPGAKKLPEVSLRRNVFIQGREHWPRATAGGLTMKALDKASDGSYTEYAYIHDKDYDAMQAVFFAYVQIGDPMRIVYLLQQVPYHVSTLLQVSMVAKQDQNMALSAELCERALFTFGRVATSAFRQDLENGRARFDFRRPENRQLWLSGYHYLKSLVRKGTYRTALEWSKLLFSLDHKDPYAMRHFIHFLAIRAYEARWLIDFVQELENTGDNRDTAYLRQSLVLAKLQLKDVDGARAELKEGMQRMPWLYCALFQELGLDTPPSIWGNNAETDSRSFWVKLYIYQTKDLWNNTATISLLQRVAKDIEKVDKASLSRDDPPPDLGTTRLVYLEGQTSIIASAPRELLDRQPNYEFDPLPPAEEENIFSGDGCRLPWNSQSPGSRAMEQQIEMQLRNLMARRQARAGGAVQVGGAAGALGGFPESDDEFDAIDMDDPELQADLEEHARRAQEPGIIQMLVQMLRGGPAPEEGASADGAEEEQQGFVGGSGDGPLPGAWPDEEDDGGGAGR